MAKRVLVSLVAGMALLVIAYVGMATPVHAQEEETSGDPGRGTVLYAQYCLSCHGPGGEALAQHEAFASTLSYSLEFADNVSQGVPGTYMTAYGVSQGGPLTEADIEDLAAFARTWESDDFESPSDLPVLVEEGLTEEEARGAELYILNCSGCHGNAGQGRDQLANFPPIGEHVDVLAIARRGVSDSGMPPFSQDYGGPLTTEDLTAIQSYVRSWDRTTPLAAAAADEPKGIWQLLIGGGLLGLVIAAIGVWTQRDH